MTKNLLIPANVVQALVKYLATKPYAEVAQLIDILSSLPATPAVVTPKPKDKEPVAS